MEEDLVHQAVQAVAEAAAVHVAVVHPAVHVAHAAEASHVVEDVPNHQSQRAAVARSQSKC